MCYPLEELPYMMFKLVAVLSLIVAVWGAPQTRSVLALDGRIVGGQNADIADYPYQVSLQYYGSHICGGAIIAANWVATAGHCTAGFSAAALTIRAGTTNRGSGGQTVAVSRIVSHPSYSGWTIDYDISLLQLSEDISTPNAQPIALPTSGSGPTDGATTIITGWGTLTESGSSPIQLQVVEVPVVSQSTCRSAYGSSSITDRMFCAGLLGVGGKDACQGDSGGPAVVGGVLSGLVSWGYGCARPAYPGVYTNVASLRSWIKDQTGL